MMTASVSSLATFKTGACRTSARDNRTWGRVQAEHVRRTGLGKEETSIAPDRHLVLLNLKGTSERGEYFLDGKPGYFVPRRPGAVLFIPAGCSWKGWETGAATAAYLSIMVDPTLVSELLGRSPAASPKTFTPNAGCEDPVLMHAANAIGGEIRDRSPLSLMLVESYVATIFAQLLRKQRYVPDLPRLGGLTPKNLNRVIGKIEEDLACHLSLAQLSDLVGLSIPHFCRAFKQTVGCPPYAFVLRRRIEKAKELLRHSSMPLTDIALACGFSSSSHFSNAFRREAGMPPRSFREP